MRTADEVLAACIARGIARSDCEAKIRDHMVDGVYCDGTIVMTATGSRCVPHDLADRVREAREASPLEAPPVTAEPEDGAGSGWLAPALVVVVLGVLVVVALRKGG